MKMNLDEQSIIKILGIEALDDDRKADVLERAAALVQKRMLVRIMEHLDETKRKEFEALLEGKNQASLEAFLAANVPEFTDWMMDEVRTLKAQFADIASNIE